MADIPATCKAAVLCEYGEPDVIMDVKIPEIEQGGVLVKVMLAGICGTDVHQQRGELSIKPPTPIIQGHETLGQIVKLGAGLERDMAGAPLKEGDRIMWAHTFCGKCYACKVLRKPFMCYSSKGYGFAPPEALRGGFAEYEYVSPGTDIVRVPDEITDEEAIGVGCAFRTVVNGYEKLELHGGIPVASTVVIQGCGPVGLYATVMAAQSAAAQVIVIGAPAERLELAKEFGATHVINIDNVRDAGERLDMVRSLTGERGAEIVVECSGYPPAFNEGMDLLAAAGTYLVMGQTSTQSVNFVPNMVMSKQAVILGSGSADITHFYKALQFIKGHRGKYPFEKIVSRRYRLEEINEALENMRKGMDIKAVVDNRNR